MKRKLHRHIAIIITLALILSINVGAIDAVEDIKNTDVIRNQDAALNAYDKLAVYLGLDSVEKEPTWPEEYAGCYINDDELVICLTENNAEMQTKYRNICGNNILFQEAEYSKRDVEELYSILSTYSGIDGVTAVYRSRNNTVTLMLDDADKQVGIETYLREKMNKARSVDSLVEYRVVTSTDTYSVSENNEEIGLDVNEQRNVSPVALGPGSYIRNSLGSFSLGVWVKRGGAVGILTCGHAFHTNNGYMSTAATVSAYNSSNNLVELGVATSGNVIYGNGTMSDFAFVPLTNHASFTGTLTAVNGDVISSVRMYDPPEGTTVYAVGQKATAYNYNRVSGTLDGDAVSFDHCDTISSGYIVDFDPDGPGTYKGDSGGPVYIASGNAYSLIGFVSSGHDEIVSEWVDDNGERGLTTTHRYGYMAKAYLAFNSLGLTLYS